MLQVFLLLCFEKLGGLAVKQHWLRPLHAEIVYLVCLCNQRMSTQRDDLSPTET